MSCADARRVYLYKERTGLSPTNGKVAVGAWSVVDGGVEVHYNFADEV